MIVRALFVGLGGPFATPGSLALSAPAVQAMAPQIKRLHRFRGLAFDSVRSRLWYSSATLTSPPVEDGLRDPHQRERALPCVAVRPPAVLHTWS
jgi:hypothetical protein